MTRLRFVLERLDERVMPTVAPGILPSSVYLDPTLLSFADAPSPVESTSDLVALDQKYAFSEHVASYLEWQNYNFNWGGAGEKWLATPDGWCFLLPHGDLYRWQGGSYPLAGTLIARLGDSPLDPSMQQQLVDADQTYHFYSANDDYLGWGGRSEKWLHMAGGGWCYILPDGRVYQWDQGSFPLQGTLLASFPAGDTYLPGSDVYRYPTSLTTADSATPLESGLSPYELWQKYGFTSTGNFWQNWAGLNERWLQDLEARWYCLLPHGALYRWDSPTGMPGTLFARLDPSIYENPEALIEPLAPVPAAPAAISLISQTNRSHLPDAISVGQSGGFSPEQRSLMRASDGSLWFTEDIAHDYWTNHGTRYWRQDPATGD